MKIQLDNENTGAAFIDTEENKTFNVDSTEYGNDPRGISVTAQEDGEFSVVFPEDAWATIICGKLVIKYCQYQGEKETIDFLNYDVQ